MLPAVALTLAVAASKPARPPISIESCRFVKSASFSRGVRIAYKNDAKVAAKLVIFEVWMRGHHTALIDEGSFAPGATVDHMLTSEPMTLWMGEYPTQCAVTHVHFTDGSTWP